MSDIKRDGKSSLDDLDLNLEFNRDRWGQAENWHGKDKYGTRWGGGYQQENWEVTRIADTFLWPHIKGYGIKILELSPGGGRFTAEIIRRASELHLLDMNNACLDVCRERFKYFPVPQHFYQNDGRDCSMVEDLDFDLIACFDSMVHMHPQVAEGYVQQLSRKLGIGGVLFLDHPGMGKRSSGHRTDIRDSDVKAWGTKAGLDVISQDFRNKTGDCISVFVRTK